MNGKLLGIPTKYLGIGLAVLLVLGAAGALARSSASQSAAAAPTATPEPPNPVTAKATIRATRQSKLSFRVLGQIVSLPKEDDRVEAGQEIAQLDTADLDLAITQASDALAVAQSSQSQAEEPARPVDLAALQAAYDQAAARHNQLLAGPTAADLQAAKTAVTSAESALRAAEAKLKQQSNGPTRAETTSAESAVAQASAALASAKQRQDALDPASKLHVDDVRAAQLTLEAAKNTLWSTQVDRDATKGLYGANSAQGRAADARVGAAETAVTQAKVALDSRSAPAAESDKRAAAQAVTSAQAELTAANARLEQTRAGASAADLQAGTSGVSAAQAALEAARAKLDQLQIGPTENDRKASAASVAEAKAALDQRQAGLAPAESAVFAARVKQARTALEQAKSSRRAATISAPFSGTVVSVDASVGDTAQPGSPVLTIADLTKLQVETSDLDEGSATLLKVGQPVKVTVNAFVDNTGTVAKVLPGTIKEIAPLATMTSSGDANYTVIATLDQPDPSLRLGMTAKVDFGVTK